LASPLFEIEKIISQYQIGEFIENHNPTHIAKKINELLISERLHAYKANTNKASKEITWEKEKQNLIAIINQCSII
jgi:hypothetical protein